MLTIDGATYLSNVEATSPGSEPITTAEAKTHMRVTHSSEDTLIASLITAARSYIEQLCNRPLINRTFTLKLDRFPSYNEIVLPSGKASAVSSITYVDQTGATQTLSASNYTLEGDRLPSSIVLNPTNATSWPTTRYEKSITSVTVSYTAGFGATAASVPQPIKQAILMTVAYWYDQAREAAADQSYQDAPHGVEILCRIYSVPRAW